MVLIALAFVGLAAFIGLAVDAGILFNNIGHLRRATDAASLAAANQFREGRTPPELSVMAHELLILNGLTPTGVVAKICDLSNYPDVPLYPDYHDETLCPGGSYPPPSDVPFTKQVRVEAELPVDFAFLPIVGWDKVTIEAEAISQAASIDLVLVIDNSGSMAFDLCGNDQDDDGEDDGEDCFGFPPFFNVIGTYAESDPDLCNAAGTCEPFESIRTAALGLLDNMFFPYDRMSVVTFSDLAATAINLTNGTSHTLVETAINGMQVSGPWPHPPCDPGRFAAGDPRGCTTTNTAAGLTLAGNLLADNDGDGDLGPLRESSVWIVILLSDGAANAALATGGDPADPNAWICPPPGGPAGFPTWVATLCRDKEFEIGQGEFGFDAEDAAVDAALFVGCPDASLTQPNGCEAANPGGQNAVIFTIGYGDLVIDNPNCDLGAYPEGCEPNQGEELLRYIADIGDDHDPTSRPCKDKPTSSAGNPVNCGNYFFAADQAQLEKVFEAIASRIFTRITH